MVRLVKLAKRTLSITMSVLLVSSSFPVSTFAIGGDWGEDEGGIWVDADSKEVTVDKSDTDYKWVEVSSENNGTANLAVGSVTNDSGTAAIITTTSSTSNVQTGDIKAAYDEENDDDDPEYYADGVYAETGGTNSTVTISTGDIGAYADGVYAETYGTNSTVTISTGDIGAYEDGVYAETYGTNSAVTISTGDIETDDDDGIDVYTYGESNTVTVTTGNIVSGDDGIYADTYGINNEAIITTGDIESDYSIKTIDSSEDVFLIGIQTNPVIQNISSGVYQINLGKERLFEYFIRIIKS